MNIKIPRKIETRSNEARVRIFSVDFAKMNIDKGIIQKEKRGERRGFDFGTDDFRVLDNLVSVLLEENEKHTSINSKITELNRYLNTQARIDAVRSALLNNKNIWQQMT